MTLAGRADALLPDALHFRRKPKPKKDLEVLGVEELEDYIAELEAELNRAKLYVQLRKAERDVAREELADATNKLEHMTSDRNEWRVRCILVQQKHQKLSGIVRLALTPDEYHLYRTAYENSEGA